MWSQCVSFFELSKKKNTIVCMYELLAQFLNRTESLFQDFGERKEFYFDLNVKLNLSSLSLRWAIVIL